MPGGGRAQRQAECELGVERWGPGQRGGVPVAGRRFGRPLRPVPVAPV